MCSNFKNKDQHPEGCKATICDRPNSLVKCNICRKRQVSCPWGTRIPKYLEIMKVAIHKNTVEKTTPAGTSTWSVPTPTLPDKRLVREVQAAFEVAAATYERAYSNLIEAFADKFDKLATSPSPQ
jgi:hypothetical protein